MTTWATPFYLMFGREMRSKLPDLQREAPITNEEVRDGDWSRKVLQKEYVDAERTAVGSEVDIGDKALLRKSKTNKLSPNYDPNPCEVVDRKGGEVTIRSPAGAEIRRNVSFVKKYQEKPSEAKVDVEPVHQEQEGTNQAEVGKGENELLRPGLTGSLMSVQQAPTCISSPLKQMASPRPTRNVRPPKRFDDYELSKG